MSAPIVVGYDGSVDSRIAVDFALAEAELRERGLVIVYARLTPIPTLPFEATYAWHQDNSEREAAEKMLAQVAAEIRADAEHVVVDTEIVDTASASTTLVDKSRSAHLIVVGSRGRGGISGLLLGSTSSQVAGHAHCPVLVTRRNVEYGDPRGVVAVGVDGSELSDNAVGFAFATASMRGAELLAVHAWRPLVPRAEVDFADVEADILTEAVAPWRSRYPDVPVRLRSVSGGIRDVLLEEAAGADLLVVGSRGRGGFAGLILGSTSQAMLHHAAVPVAVVHP
ncbi:nucleotide-binding universal stress UspA family protein [Stackebrandtia endophytica]|uniref:Nucleotide-binding universal stress UspA family protein n=1 Tax=Stackebrandtia endophytica TaxID=1496996 RepID=A0A543B3R5_9ACTN|nr:universal stress protein [Stackebrandtia endophytica]TQL79442.1 nucleotide-binding universal stress UspA family protein [Stackebrandtia endophytica]